MKNKKSQKKELSKNINQKLGKKQILVYNTLKKQKYQQLNPN